MIAFFKLIRGINLLIIALVQYMIRFFIIESLGIPHALDLWQFSLGVLCSISLAAAGYIINDIYDIDPDTLNKPGRITVGRIFSENTAWMLYGVINIIAIISGYILAHIVDIKSLWLLPVVAAALLYLYSIDLKKRAVIGNVIVSLLTAMPVFLVGVFDILPAATPENAGIVKPAFYVIMGYSGFAFFTNFIREIVKDAEDLEGDERHGYRTLAILLGRSAIRYIIFILTLVLLSFTGAFNVFLFKSDVYSAFYIVLFVNLPILYFIFKVMTAKTNIDFKQASTLMKIIMLTGIVSMAVFTLSLKYQFT